MRDKTPFIVLSIALLSAHAGIRIYSDAEDTIVIDEYILKDFHIEYPSMMIVTMPSKEITLVPLTTLSLEKTWSRTLSTAQTDVYEDQCEKKKPIKQTRPPPKGGFLFIHQTKWPALTCRPFFYFTTTFLGFFTSLRCRSFPFAICVLVIFNTFIISKLLFFYRNSVTFGIYILYNPGTSTAGSEQSVC